MSTIRVLESDERLLNKQSPSVEILNVISVDPAFRDYIKVVDTVDDLVCLKFLTPVLEDGSVDANLLKHFGHVRGIIVDTKTNKVVCKSFPYTPEILVEELDSLNLDLSRSFIYKACEGTIIRAFYRSETQTKSESGWILSTHGRIDATNSYWAGPDFKTLFDELNVDFSQFDENMCYTFLLSNGKNRLVYEIEQPQLLHITSYDRVTQKFCPEVFIQGIPGPHRIYPSSLDVLKDMINAASSFDFAGVIILTDLVNPDPIKVISSSYYNIREIRGNEPSLKTRYLQLRNTPECQILVEWYNDDYSKEIYAKVEASLEKLSQKLHKMYINRFVQKDLKTLFKEEYCVIQKAHQLYIKDHEIITLDRMKKVLATIPYYFVLIMINR